AEADGNTFVPLAELWPRAGKLLEVGDVEPPVSGRVRIPTSSQVGVTSEADPCVDAGAPAAHRGTAAIDERDHERCRTPTDTTH
ncbi:MAG: hypothetical protein ACREND_03210, partial [Gemmatimonadaceae bacterium]